MTEWGERLARPLRALHLDSIRTKILALALLAALIPALATTIISYGRTRRALGEKVDQQLRGTSSETARALDLWLDERLDEPPAACATISPRCGSASPRSKHC